jgi:hypothetical protein
MVWQVLRRRCRECGVERVVTEGVERCPECKAEYGAFSLGLDRPYERPKADQVDLPLDGQVGMQEMEGQGV